MIQDGPLGTVIAKVNIGKYIIQDPLIYQCNIPFWIRFINSRLVDFDEDTLYIPFGFVMEEYSINLLEYDLSALCDINKNYIINKDYIRERWEHIK